MLLFGVRQRGLETDELTDYNLDEQRVADQPRDLDAIRTKAEIAIQQSQRKNESQYAKRSVLPRKYVEGEYVVIRNVDTLVGQNKKLIPNYRGPYVVHRMLANDRYITRDTDKLSNNTNTIQRHT